MNEYSTCVGGGDLGDRTSIACLPSGRGGGLGLDVRGLSTDDTDSDLDHDSVMAYTPVMMLLLLLSCVPDHFHITADLYDVERECWDRDVTVTLDTKYWKELYLRSGDYCGDNPDARATFDGRCMFFDGGCDDERPLIEDDPNFAASQEQQDACNDRFHSDEVVPDCEPALTAWP